MDMTYGLLSLLAAPSPPIALKGSLAEDAYYARFAESPLARLSRFFGSRDSAGEGSRPLCAQYRRGARPSAVMTRGPF